ncbi:MAG: hypothetical protein J7K81_04280 [Methanophagales archaeon]|nr:hypothetical protein [Methanophagales archaeon]
MKKYRVTYREEWRAEVEAVNKEEAIKKFKEPKTKKEVLFDLWDDFFQIEERGT